MPYVRLLYFDFLFALRGFAVFVLLFAGNSSNSSCGFYTWISRTAYVVLPSCVILDYTYRFIAMFYFNAFTQDIAFCLRVQVFTGKHMNHNSCVNK